MKFIVDVDAKDMLIQLCDIALKQGGIKNMKSIQKIINSIEDFSETDDSFTCKDLGEVTPEIMGALTSMK